MERTQKRDRWLDVAVMQIRFRPDQRQVREELDAHLEDEILDLQRIFSGMTQEEAEERALAQMGDPAEVAWALAKVHRPWLGWLWRFSQGALGVLAVAFLLLCFVQETSYDNFVWGGYYGRPYASPQALEPERASLGGYTFRILEAVYQTEEDGPGQLQVTFTASNPRFWERISEGAVYRSLSVAAEDGQRWVTQGRGGFLQDPSQPVLWGMDSYRWGLFHREFTAFVQDAVWQEGDWVTLELGFPIGEVVLRAKVTETAEVVYP
ncbi:MAG: hypothetical protein HFF50_07615 [Lawsonibacter sp.]|nr:hypothetical protein [Lawsonibacter sp.]